MSQSQVGPSQWVAGAGAETQPMPCSVRTLKPTRGSPSQGKANDPQERRQDLLPISECTTYN